MHPSSITIYGGDEALAPTAEWVEFNTSVDYRASKIANCERKVAALCKPISHYCDLVVNVFDAFLSFYEKYMNDGDEFARERAFSLGKRLHNFLNEVLPHHESYNVDCWDIHSVLFVETRLGDCIRIIRETSNMIGQTQDISGAKFSRQGESGEIALDPPKPSDKGTVEIDIGSTKKSDQKNDSIRQSLRLRDVSDEGIIEKNQNGKGSRNAIVLESTEVGISDLVDISDLSNRGISEQNSIGDSTVEKKQALQSLNNCHGNDDPTSWQNIEVVTESNVPRTSRMSFISLIDLWKRKEQTSINLKENNR